VKVVLREHVEHLGERGQIVSVAPGFARNYLLPKSLAYEATPGNMKVLDHQRRVWEVKENKEIGEAQAIADRLAEIEISITKKAGESGTLYGSVTNSELAEELATKGVEVDRRRITIPHPIKALGSYDIPIKLHPKVAGQFKLHVVTAETSE